MDQQIREMLSSEIGHHVGWFVREQTKHLVEAMPCVCDIPYVQDGIVLFASHGERCNRCNKLEELKE